MKKLFLKTAILISTVSMLTACGGGGGGGGGVGTTTNNQTSTPLAVLNVSGTATTLEGTWQAPCDSSFSISGADGIVSTIEFSGSTVTVTDVTWVGDPGCTGAPTKTESYSGTGTVDSAANTVSGWATMSIDAGGVPLVTSTTSPDASDGSGSLSDNEPFSLIAVEITSSAHPSIPVGAMASEAFIVDDTGSTPVLYGVFYDGSPGYVGLANLYYAVPVSTASSINIVTASGGSLGLEGAWASDCIISGSTSSSSTMSVTVDVWTFNQATWDGNTTCTGTPTSVTSYTGNIGTDVTQNLTGWIDQNVASASGPAALDGSGSLADDVSYTMLYATITDSTEAGLIGNTVTFFYVADDSVAGIPLLYSGNPMDSTASNFGPLGKL